MDLAVKRNPSPAPLMDPRLEAVLLRHEIETFNARCMSPAFNERAQAFAKEHDLPGTAGSDAHSALELGRAVMLLPPFEDTDGLKSALRQARFEIQLSSPLVHFISRYANWYKKITGRRGARQL